MVLRFNGSREQNRAAATGLSDCSSKANLPLPFCRASNHVIYTHLKNQVSGDFPVSNTRMSMADSTRFDPILEEFMVLNTTSQ